MDVAVAVILNDKGQILITRRPLDASQGGRWEFPGGKLEQGESSAQALSREIKEEVNLDIIETEFLGKLSHAYSDRTVNLFVYLVNRFSGTALCKEAQMGLQWVSLTELESGKFRLLDANDQIIELLRLCEQYHEAI